ncbi:hypothetical protein IC229_02815 [Spirosoma sp. BT702]|uniref:DUF4352 domain-containing protein n=1 Tax=Spirosoma profusum TaxID=2771354 RepID=A0A927AT86_9BACT|nr:hypothetical protein [Spirosoma profusum]MBD2699552.1 hypothetical protein [Spirosoma profusum]
MRTNRLVSKLVVICLAIWGISCTSADKSEKQEGAEPPVSVTQAATPAEENPTSPTTAVTTTPAILSTQNGPDGAIVDLTKAAVNGSILSVEVQYRHGTGGKGISSKYDIEQVSVVDEANAKKYSVLKDQAGKYMASPIWTDKGQEFINVNIPSFKKDEKTAVWFKFPAPPADTKTISVTIPEVGSFNGIPISR